VVDIMPLRTYEPINKKIVFDAVANTFDINPKDLSIKKEFGWTYITFTRENIDYDICRFGEDRKSTFIYLNKYAFNEAGLGEISKGSARAMAEELEKRLGTDKEIHIYMEIASNGYDELDGYVARLYYPEKKGVLKRIFRRE